MSANPTTLAQSPGQPSDSAEHVVLQGLNILLMGPAGTGKTYSIGTLVDAGYEVFYLAMEAGMESLIGYYTDKGKPVPDNLHWHKLDAPKASFLELIDAATKINSLSLESLSKMQDPHRTKHNTFIQLLTALNNFPDDRTGKTFGPVNEWDTKRVLVIDPLTGLSRAAMSLVVGGKPVRNQADWGIAQDTLEKLLLMLSENCACHFVLLAHVERETDQVLGGVKLMVSTLGRALPPKIPPMFSDVILSVRNADKWTWDTANPQADLKTRNLSVRSDNPPSFAPIFAKWQSRNAGTSTEKA